jgi:ribosome-binding factor A
MSRRTDRIGDLIRSELSMILRREVADPRVSLASINEVDVSPDLRHARVWVSVLGPDEDREVAIETLRKAAGFIRRQLGRHVNLRATPELVFELDHGAEHGQRIAELLEEIKSEQDPT